MKGESRDEETKLTHIGEVVHEYDFLYEVCWGSVENAVHSPQEDAPGLVVKANDDAGRREGVAVLLVLAPGGKNIVAVIILNTYFHLTSLNIHCKNNLKKTEKRCRISTEKQTVNGMCALCRLDIA